MSKNHGERCLLSRIFIKKRVNGQILVGNECGKRNLRIDLRYSSGKTDSRDTLSRFLVQLGSRWTSIKGGRSDAARRNTLFAVS